MHATRTGRCLRLALATLALGATAAAQTNPPPSKNVALDLDTGTVRNTGIEAGAVAVFHVLQEGAPWMRLYFSEVLLAEGSTLKITSLQDGYFQVLNAKSAVQWGNTSAYFNGDLLAIELYAQPGSGPNRVAVDRVEVGLLPPPVEESLCGTDDRVASNDPRAARILPIGCTGFLIDDDCGCFLTAGHCSSGTSVVQFNVPLSNSNGSLNNPPPQDQYAVDRSSVQSNGGQGIGNDWAYFGVFPNSTTGLTPSQAQGEVYDFASPPAWNSSLQIRITGYGVDGGTANQTQQTSVGPWLSYSPGSTTLEYVTDTQGGNSGSPIIQEDNGTTIGIHTHGGCNPPNGGNFGTASVHSGLQNALANPKGVCFKLTCGVTPQTTFRNGNGTNPPCLQSLTPPVLGGQWTIRVDGTAVPAATFSIVQGRKIAVNGPTVSFGQLLFSLSTPPIFASIRPISNGESIHNISLPPNLELAGFDLTVQGVLTVGETLVQLCNAEDAILGCTQ